jgi:hypothetical protein
MKKIIEGKEVCSSKSMMMMNDAKKVVKKMPGTKTLLRVKKK